VTGYLAAEGYLDELLAELGEGVLDVRGRLVLHDAPARHAAWARNTWFDAVELPVASVNDAARALTAIQRNWALHSTAAHRRAALIAAKLPHVSAHPLRFPAPLPASPLGSWTLLDRDRLLAAARCSSPFPDGEARFVEDKEGPPNRAYLKLWEALTLLERWPREGELCVDLGASPGGWTWALARLGARVVSVDKAPLDPRVAPLAEHRSESAFAVEPFPVDWLCCDVVCYPRRLLGLVRRWLGAARNMVCTVKFQGRTDHAVAREFASIEGARLVHLAHNKHELTFLWPAHGAQATHSSV
jgi:23S rRNA (cytidine2498-2'-O)-methyltransferase